MSRGCTRSSRPSGHGRPSGASPGGSASSALTCPATQAASSAAVSVSAQVTRPRLARPGGGTSRGTSGAAARNPSCSTAATSRTRPVFRKLVDSMRTSAGSAAWLRPLPVTTGKSRPNRRRLPALAPRQP